jgi:hypothetical protein
LDRQHEPAYCDIVTYEDAAGIRCVVSHLVPKSKDDVVRRSRASYE